MSVGSGPGPWTEILELARRTPSPHNTQPWKVRQLDDRRIEVWLDPARALPDEDVTGCFILAALAMYVEVLRILAANRGFGLAIHEDDAEAVRRTATRDADVSVSRRADLVPDGPGLAPDGSGLAPDASGLAPDGPGLAPDGSDLAPDGSGLVRYARIELVSGRILEPRFDDEVLRSRRTSRLAPTDEPIPRPAMTQLESLAAPLGYTLHLIDDADTVAHIMRLNLDAVTEDLTTPTYRDEIKRWFRYGERHEKETRDGLSARCMNMPPYELRLLSTAAAVAKWPVIGRVVRALYRRRLGAVPRLAILEGPFWTAEAAVQAGTCLMRLWLGLERHGFRIHPFGNLITNGEANRRLRDATGIRDPWIVFRVGRTAEPPRSERLSAEEVLVG